ncbi:thiol reductase thioredoxin [Sporosarcina sp. P34]|uniref:thioredoxin family protein n=1 Tax=Sporosarcina sp. P34 TaxID=2048247 RepID=UPI000C16F8B5|nr:thioredoxin family protein [Sporosarcina sp. P34]PID14545.1 thiol reductase thioredoxin [Sporosarcina sp. P34]
MNHWTIEDWQRTQAAEQVAAFYLYTPMCGTCAVASKMLTVIETMRPQLPIGKADLNYIQEIATEYEVESVPCLLIQRKGQPVEKIYAFQSVPYLLEKLS